MNEKVYLDYDGLERYHDLLLQQLETKADKVSNSTSGNFASLTNDGNIADSGHAHSDYVLKTDLEEIEEVVSASLNDLNLRKADSTALAVVATSGSYNDLSNIPTIPIVTDKADKVIGATSGNFAGLDSNGNLIDSGSKADDFNNKIRVSLVSVTVTLTNVTCPDTLENGQLTTVIYKNNGSADYTVALSTNSSYVTPDGQPLILTCPEGGYCEISYLKIDNTIFVRGV